MAIHASLGKPVLASEELTIADSVLGLTSTKYRKQVGGNASDLYSANSAFITIEDQPLRINLDPAVTVSATANGHEFAAGDSFIVEGAANIANLRAIRTGGTSGVLHVTYFG
jgi:hypothetical protein